VQIEDDEGPDLPFPVGDDDEDDDGDDGDDQEDEGGDE